MTARIPNEEDDIPQEGIIYRKVGSAVAPSIFDLPLVTSQCIGLAPEVYNKKTGHKTITSETRSMVTESLSNLGVQLMIEGMEPDIIHNLMEKTDSCILEKIQKYIQPY